MLALLYRDTLYIIYFWKFFLLNISDFLAYLSRSMMLLLRFPTFLLISAVLFGKTGLWTRYVLLAFLFSSFHGFTAHRFKIEKKTQSAYANCQSIFFFQLRTSFAVMMTTKCIPTYFTETLWSVSFLIFCFVLLFVVLVVVSFSRKETLMSSEFKEIKNTLLHTFLLIN